MTGEPVYWPETPESYHKNQARCQGSEQPCFICGRPVKQPRYWARTWEGAGITTDEYAEAHPQSDTGGYPIGPECVKTLPAHVRPMIYDQKRGGKL